MSGYMRLTREFRDFNCNWLGGQVVADEIDAPGYEKAGFVNITTSDGQVHGQVRQSGLYSFVRIYEAGHEVPFYQPLASLEMFERAISRKDLATGKKHITNSYKTKGTPTSDYREGNSTVVFKVLPSDATYNTTLNGPNLSPSESAKFHWQGKRGQKKRSSGKYNKPRRSVLGLHWYAFCRARRLIY